MALGVKVNMLDLLIYNTLVLMEKAVCLLPERIAQKFASFLGYIWYYVIPIRKKVALQNLQLAYGDQLSPREKRQIVAGMMINICKSLVEFFRVNLYNANSIQVEGEENYQKAKQSKKGIIVVSCHLGNFDLGVCLWASLRGDLAIVTKFLGVKGVNRYWQERRSRYGVTLIPPKNSASQIKAALKGGGIVAMMLDQHTPRNALTVNFFGHKAATTKAPVIFSEWSGAPILPVFVTRIEDGHQKIEILPPIYFEPGEKSRNQATLDMVARLNLLVEDKIRETPQQWFWLHRRWKISYKY